MALLAFQDCQREPGTTDADGKRIPGDYTDDAIVGGMLRAEEIEVLRWLYRSLSR